MVRILLLSLLLSSPSLAHGVCKLYLKEWECHVPTNAAPGILSATGTEFILAFEPMPRYIALTICRYEYKGYLREAEAKPAKAKK